MRQRWWPVRAAAATAAFAAVVLVAPARASAAVNESYEHFNSDRCASIEFVDSGTMDGRTNDDFYLIHDYCADSHGVRAYVKGIQLDEFGNPDSFSTSRYSGNGLAGPPLAWDPVGNLIPGEFVETRVCLVDGASDTTPFRCSGWRDQSVIDG
jgi:hypothetical protein